ncbi:hypothetical protein KBZ08_04325 [Cyanobium sp. Candia 9D4]|uniref:N-acetyltransferase n=1 Tax=Aphanothece cf. minutissima CCALA 015 TaxID=2107695 RepID=A0ABX5FDD6_9CHRO|nr:hypothetical protein [Cyanobium sp. Candia 9D4]PSB38973.1 hypothetical protein C7B81_04900 [Aphanothece cf. minutissima CCALA 015]
MEPLQGWHLPLLDDPAFLPLQPLLQRSLLLALPEQLLTAVTSRRPLAAQVLVALQRQGLTRQQALGLIVCRRLNRSGTCWQVQHLRLALAASEGAAADGPAPSRAALAGDLLRQAIGRVKGAASWIATASSLDTSRLATLREQGFQPQRTDRLWRWQLPAAGAAPVPPADLQLRPLNRRTAPLLWHLEQATCPAHLRQLQDRRIEDLLDQSRGQGWMLVDGVRNEAVAGVRLLDEHPGGGQAVELSIHPGWGHLLGPAAESLLHRIGRGGASLWLRCEVGDGDRQLWLQALGAEAHGEEVLMARSVWRRQEGQPAKRAARRIEAVLEQLQPRRRPMPTPTGPLGSLPSEPLVLH